MTNGHRKWFCEGYFWKGASIEGNIKISEWGQVLKRAFDLFPVLNKKDNFQLDERKKIAKNYISDLMVLTTKEKEYLDRFEEKKYMPELLFEDVEIVERVKNHPMALWKCKE